MRAVCHARAALREQPHNGRRQRLRYNAFVRIAGACSVHGDAGERDADAEAAFRAALVSGNAAAWVEAVQAPCHLAPTEACVHVWPAHFQFEGPGLHDNLITLFIAPQLAAHVHVAHPDCVIHSLSLQRTRVRGYGISQLSKALNLPTSSVTTLSLVGTNVDGAAALATILAYPHCALRRLSVDYCNLDSNAMKLLSGVLRLNQSLQVLRFSLRLVRGSGSTVQHHAIEHLRTTVVEHNATLLRIDCNTQGIYVRNNYAPYKEEVEAALARNLHFFKCVPHRVVLALWSSARLRVREARRSAVEASTKSGGAEAVSAERARAAVDDARLRGCPGNALLRVVEGLPRGAVHELLQQLGHGPSGAEWLRVHKERR